MKSICHKMVSSMIVLMILNTVVTFCGDKIRWEDAGIILRRIHPPAFKEQNFSLSDFGAVNDGKSDCTDAFRTAIDSCHAAGGGTVTVPAGVFMTGPIHLKSNVNLFLSKGTVVKFLTDPQKYLPVVFTRYEGIECMNYSPFIYAFEQENIAITGEGVFDGQGSNETWWKWKGKEEYGWKKGMPSSKKGRDLLMKMAENNIPVAERLLGEGFFLPPNFVQPYKCINVLISGVTFLNSPMWFLNPVLCKNVIVENVTVRGHGPNNDGCDPESSSDVLIRGCTFDTGDDCIAIKSGRNADGRRVNVPSENIVIQNCDMKDGHGGVVIGSEVSGSVRNVFVEDCRMDSPNLDRALRFKTNSVRGGVIENFFARRITVGQVAEAVVLIDFYYEEKDSGPFTPVMRNVYLENITAKKGKYGFHIKGYERSPITNFNAMNCSFTGVAEGNIFENVKDFSFSNVSVNGAIVPAPANQINRPWSIRIAENFLRLHPASINYNDEEKSKKWNYEQGLMLEAFYQMKLHTNDDLYAEYIRNNLDLYIRDDGSITTYKLNDFNIDNVAPGKALLRAFSLSRENKYRFAADTLRRQLALQPRTSEGGFWHKKIYPHQMWLDGLYMGEPFYTLYSLMFNDPAAFDDIAKQFLLIGAHARDKKTGLFFHGWDESREQRWADKETGCSPHLWGRSLGWFAMALADVLEYFPADHPKRKELESMFRNMMEDLLQQRDPASKLWYQIVDKQREPGNYLEASASAMFTYAFAKGVNKGYLEKIFAAAAKESFSGILKYLVTVDGNGLISLNDVCSVAGLGGNPYRDGSYEYYINEPRRTNDFKGYGPFLLAAIEIERLKKQ